MRYRASKQTIMYSNVWVCWISVDYDGRLIISLPGHRELTMVILGYNYNDQMIQWEMIVSWFHSTSSKEKRKKILSHEFYAFNRTRHFMETFGTSTFFIIIFRGYENGSLRNSPLFFSFCLPCVLIFLHGNIMTLSLLLHQGLMGWRVPAESHFQTPRRESRCDTTVF